jgi:hypothetical protein
MVDARFAARKRGFAVDGDDLVEVAAGTVRSKREVVNFSSSRRRPKMLQVLKNYCRSGYITLASEVESLVPAVIIAHAMHCGRVKFRIYLEVRHRRKPDR